MSAPPLIAPKLPIYGPQTFDGPAESPLPCLLDRPGLQFTTNGRAAILLGLTDLALSGKDLVLVPTYHCPTMVSPVLAVGAQVGFYPIDELGRPQLEWLEAHAPASTRVLCVTHLFGLPLDLSRIQAWCRARGVTLLEDCAHALFGEGPSGPVGSHGDIVIASLPKFLPTLEGGALIRARATPLELRPAGTKAELRTWLNLLEIADGHGRLGAWPLRRGLVRLKALLRRRPAPVAAASADVSTSFDPEGDYAKVDPGLARRALTRVAARVARRSAKARVVSTRRSHYEAMSRAFAGRPGVRPLLPRLPAGAVPYVFPLWVDRPDPAYQDLREQGVPLSRWDWLWPGVPQIEGDCGPLWAHHVLQLPCHQDLSEGEREALVGAILDRCAV